jgi:NodT family efflux transporter outer membrane factor (OMF) lipoprotein
MAQVWRGTPKDRMRPPIALLAALVLAACSVGPQYEAPKLEIPAAYRGDPTHAAGAWPGAEWWHGFKSPELDELLAARMKNFDIAAAAARVREADAQLIIAGAPLLPTASLQASDQWSATPARSQRLGTVETRTYSVGPTASWEVDVWGRLRAGRDAALANALGSRFDQAAVGLTTVASIASTWFQALSLQDRIDVARRNLGDAEEILKAIQARQDAGTASALDVAQQAALVAGIRAAIPGLQAQLSQQMLGLGLLVGRPPSAIDARPGTLNALSLPETAPGLPSALLARRPDVALAEANLIAANANIRAARAAFFPDVSLTGSGGWQSFSALTLFSPAALAATVTASVVQPIFQNGKLTAQVDYQQAVYDELLATYRKAVVQAFTDVENAVAAYRLSTEQEAREHEAVEVAQRAADIAREQVRAGTLDLVTALQAQTTLFSDLDLLAQVRLARFQALLSLYKAMGGGWSKEDVEGPAVRLFQGVL